MTHDQPSPVNRVTAASSRVDAIEKLGEMLDGKFKVLTVLEADVDSYTVEALRVSDERAVIVRLLKPEASKHNVITERFNREANKLQLLVHHNVPRCTEIAITEKGQSYAVLAYFRGNNLRQILREESCLRIERAINVVTQICAALTAAHRLGIVEHNLSPRNIYLTMIHNGMEVVKMPGVGFAETLPAVGDTFMHGTQSLVQNDAVVYKSPEACLGKNLDERSTVYSIGCLLYELLTGSVPFLGQTALETGNRHLKEAASLLEDVRPDLRFPKVLQEVVGKALKKEPEDRYARILDLQHALKEIEVSEAPAAWVKPRRIRRELKTSLPGHVSGQWNLISSVSTGMVKERTTRIRKVSMQGDVQSQIILMCVLGFSVVMAIMNAGVIFWLLPLLLAASIRLTIYLVSVATSCRSVIHKDKQEVKLPDKRVIAGISKELASSLRKILVPEKVETQIIWMCVLGFFAVLVVMRVDFSVWVMAFLVAMIVRVTMFIISPSRTSILEAFKHGEAAKLEEEQLIEE